MAVDSVQRSQVQVVLKSQTMSTIFSVACVVFGCFVHVGRQPSADRHEIRAATAATVGSLKRTPRSQGDLEGSQHEAITSAKSPCNEGRTPRTAVCLIF